MTAAAPLSNVVQGRRRQQKAAATDFHLRSDTLVFLPGRGLFLFLFFPRHAARHTDTLVTGLPSWNVSLSIFNFFRDTQTDILVFLLGRGVCLFFLYSVYPYYPASDTVWHENARQTAFYSPLQWLKWP